MDKGRKQNSYLQFCIISSFKKHLVFHRGKNHEVAPTDENTSNTTQILDAIFENYDHRVLPQFGGKLTLTFTVHISFQTKIINKK